MQKLIFTFCLMVNLLPAVAAQTGSACGALMQGRQIKALQVETAHFIRSGDKFLEGKKVVTASTTYAETGEYRETIR